MEPKRLAALLAAYPARELTNADGDGTGILLTCPVRVQWPLLDKTRTNDAGKEQHSITLIFPKDADLSVLREAEKHTAVAKWKTKPSNYKGPFNNQADKTDYEGFEDEGVFLNCSTQLEVGCFGLGGKDDPIAPGEIYGGCWVIAKIAPYAYDNKGNKGVSFGLRAVQKIADDDRLAAGKSNPGDGFGPVAGAGAANGKAASGMDGVDGW